jgi:hypothetical protein
MIVGRAAPSRGAGRPSSPAAEWTARRPPGDRLTPRHVLILTLLSAVWGASYLLIAEAAEEMPESLVVFGRTALAALALLLVVRARGGRRWRRRGGGRDAPCCSA